MRQTSMIEALIDPRLGSNERLSRIDMLINWSPIEAIERGCGPAKRHFLRSSRNMLHHARHDKSQST
jgi:hypothetical protein